MNTSGPGSSRFEPSRRPRKRPGSPGPEGAPEGRSISEAVGEYLQSEGLGELARLASIESCWDVVVGPTVAAHVRPLTLREGELAVSVDQPAWATELRFLSQKIISGLCERCGEDAVLRLKVHVRG